MASFLTETLVVYPSLVVNFIMSFKSLERTKSVFDLTRKVVAPAPGIASSLPASSQFCHGSQVAAQFVSLVNAPLDNSVWMNATSTALSHIRSLHSGDIVAISQAAVRKRWRHPVLLPALSEALCCLCMLRRASVRDISRTLEAFTKLGFTPSEAQLTILIPFIEKQLLIAAWSPADLVSTFLFFGNLGFREIHEKLQSRIEEKLGNFGAYEIASLASCEKIPCDSLVRNFARAKCPPAGVVARFADAISKRGMFMPDFCMRSIAAALTTPAEAAQLAEAAAKMRVHDRLMISTLASFIEKNTLNFHFNYADRVLDAFLQIPSTHAVILPRLARALHFSLRQKITLTTGCLLIRAVSQAAAVNPVNAGIFLDTLAETVLSQLHRFPGKRRPPAPLPALHALPEPPARAAQPRKELPRPVQRRAMLRVLKSKRRLESKKTHACIGAEQLADLMAMETKQEPRRQKICLPRFKEVSSKLSRKKENSTGLKAKVDKMMTATVRWRKERRLRLWKFEVLASRAAEFPVSTVSRHKPQRVKIQIIETLADLKGNFENCEKLAAALCAAAACQFSAAARALVSNEYLSPTSEMVDPLWRSFADSDESSLEQLIVFAKLLPSASPRSVSFEAISRKMHAGLMSGDELIESAWWVALLASLTGSEETRLHVYSRKMFMMIPSVCRNLTEDEAARLLVAAEVLGFQSVERVASESLISKDSLDKHKADFRLSLARCENVLVV